MNDEAQSKMIVERVSITKGHGDAGRYHCTVAIKGEYSNTTLELDPEHVQKVIACVSELIVNSAKEVATALTSDAMAMPALEHKLDDYPSL